MPGHGGGGHGGGGHGGGGHGGGFHGGPGFGPHGGPGFGGPGFRGPGFGFGGPGLFGPWRPPGWWGPPPVFAWWNSGTLALAGFGGWILGRNSAGTGAPATSSTTIINNYPTPEAAAQATSTASGADVELNITLVALMGPSEANGSHALFIDENLIFVLQVGESVQQANVQGKSAAQSGLSVNQTLFLPLKPPSANELQVAIYGGKENGLLALGRINLPEPRTPGGESKDISIRLNNLGGAPCGRIMTVVSYNRPIPRPSPTPPPSAPPTATGTAARDPASVAESLGWTATK